LCIHRFTYIKTFNRENDKRKERYLYRKRDKENNLHLQKKNYVYMYKTA